MTMAVRSYVVGGMGQDSAVEFTMLPFVINSCVVRWWVYTQKNVNSLEKSWPRTLMPTVRASSSTGRTGAREGCTDLKEGLVRYYRVEFRLPAEKVVPLGVSTSTWTVTAADSRGLRHRISLRATGGSAALTCVPSLSSL